jgi:hypothetical protein
MLLRAKQMYFIIACRKCIAVTKTSECFTALGVRRHATHHTNWGWLQMTKKWGKQTTSPVTKNQTATIKIINALLNKI